MAKSTKKVAIFDLDGTLVKAHLWSGIAKHHFKTKENRLSVFWYIISHMAQLPFWKIGLISTEKYYQSWGKDLAWMTKGLSKVRVKNIFNWVANEYLLPSLKKDVFERLKNHQKQGFLTILISGSFQDIVELIASQLNIDFAIGTELEIVDNRFTGKIIPPLCFGKAKTEKLKNLLSKRKLQIDFKESFAYSDGIFDLSTLEMVGNPVAVEPDEKLLKIAKDRGWLII